MRKADKNTPTGESPDIVLNQKTETKLFVCDDSLRHEAHMRFRYNKDEIDLTAGELARIDDIHNAAFAALQDICEDKEALKWDMQMIGPVVDCLVSVLKDNGHKASYPGFAHNEDGSVEYIE